RTAWDATEPESPTRRGEPMAVEIVYETHSISDHNESGIASGWLPGELSERGRALAAELGERRRHDGFDAVSSSDLRRAVQTARIAFEGSGIPLIQDRRYASATT